MYQEKQYIVWLLMKISSACNTQKLIYNFKRLLLYNKVILLKSILTGVLYDCLKLISVYLHEGDKIRKCQSCSDLMKHAHLHVGSFTLYFIKHVTVNRFYWYLKLIQSSNRNSHEILQLKFFAKKLLIQKHIIQFYLQLRQKNLS